MSYDRLPRGAEECKEALCEILKDKGIENREVCSQIVETFFFTEEHVSKDDMALLLREKGIDLSGEVIAIALQTLSNFGFAIEQRFDGEAVPRYEHLHSHAHHDHFVCVTCKRIIEFKDDELEVMQDSLMHKRGLKPLFHKLEVYGVCDNCIQLEQKSIPLSFAKEESCVVIDKVKSGKQFRKRLVELGFVEKERITVIKNGGFGPIVVEVKGARFAIGRGEASHVLVFENG